MFLARQLWDLYLRLERTHPSMSYPQSQVNSWPFQADPQYNGPKWCVDCIYYKKERDQHNCYKPYVLTIDYVEGKHTPGKCVTQRNLDRDDACGPSARWFQPRKPA